jgi:hypothetical protein
LITVCGFTGIIADMYITRFSVLSKAERYRPDLSTTQHAKVSLKKMSLKVKVSL